MRRALPFTLLALQACFVGPRPQTTYAPSQGSAIPIEAPSEPSLAPDLDTHEHVAHDDEGAEVEVDLPSPIQAQIEIGDDEGEGDDVDSAHDEPATDAKRTRAPAIALTDEQIAEKAKQDPASLGTLSIGRPNAGMLINAMQMPKGPYWELLDPSHAWGTKETIDALSAAITRVNEQFSDTAPIHIGHISGRQGGWLSPHKSHQAGRDVDVGYYYKEHPRWFVRATRENLDVARTWAFLKALITDADIDMIFMDTPIQKMVCDHAESVGEDPAFLDTVFQFRNKNVRPLVRWARGHDTHIHVRFFNPTAEELGRRAQRYLKLPAVSTTAPASYIAAHGGDGAQPSGPMTFVSHKARSGDVLVNLAKLYGTTPEAIQQANGLRGNALKIGQVYKIPVPARTPGKTSRGAQASTGRDAARNKTTRHGTQASKGKVTSGSKAPAPSNSVAAPARRAPNGKAHGG